MDYGKLNKSFFVTDLSVKDKIENRLMKLDESFKVWKMFVDIPHKQQTVIHRWSKACYFLSIISSFTFMNHCSRFLSYLNFSTRDIKLSFAAVKKLSICSARR